MGILEKKRRDFVATVTSSCIKYASRDSTDETKLVALPTWDYRIPKVLVMAKEVKRYKVKDIAPLWSGLLLSPPAFHTGSESILNSLENYQRHMGQSSVLLGTICEGHRGYSMRAREKSHPRTSHVGQPEGPYTVPPIQHRNFQILKLCQH